MCIVHNEIGSMKFINSQLNQKGFSGFSSVEDIQYFQKNKLTLQNEIVNKHTCKIQVEKNELENSLSLWEREMNKLEFKYSEQLKRHLDRIDQKKFYHNSQKIKAGLVVRTFLFFLIRTFDLGAVFLKGLYRIQLFWKLEKLKKVYKMNKKRADFILNDFDKAVFLSAKVELHKFEQKLILLNQLSPSVLGAIGEDSVVKLLLKLGDECILINDFNLKFNPPLYRKQNNEYIKSIQIDHVLVTGAGIFLIETKNWSTESYYLQNHFSPTDQILRSNYAFYRFFNQDIKDVWGRRKKKYFPNLKIPTRSLLVFLRNKPMIQKEYLKILNLEELLGYIQYFKPTLNLTEIKEIAQCLMDFNSLEDVNIK